MNLRSNSIVLEIPVRVRKSANTPEAPGTGPQGEAFCEEAKTLIVFPNGAVLKVSAKLAPGELLVLEHLRTNQTVPCRVVDAKTQSAGYVQVEFTQKMTGFWQVSFPTEFEEPPAVAESRPAAANPGVEERPLRASPTTPASAPSALETSSNAAKPFSRTSRGASGTSAPPVSPGLAVEIPTKPGLPSKSRPADSPASSPPAFLAGEAVAPPADMLSPPRRPRSSSAHHEGTTLSVPLRPEAFEAPRFALDSQDAGQRSSRARGSRWRLILACSSVILVVMSLVAVMAFRHPGHQTLVAADSGSASGSASGPGSAPVPPVTRDASVPLDTWSQPQTGPSSNAPEVVMRTPDAQKAEPTTPVQPPAPEPAGVQPAPKKDEAQAKDKTPVLEKPPIPVAAPPTVETPKQEALSPPAAPAEASTTAPAAQTSNPPGAATSEAAPASPKPPEQPDTQPQPPPQQGGVVQEPLLTRSIRPDYPAIAQQQRIQGDVKLLASLDATGNVIRVKAISGPAILYGAATDAVRRWKYQPAMLDGKPVPFQAQVTIKFRLN